MSWETIEQPKKEPPSDCAVSLSPRNGGHQRLNLTISPGLADQLGWALGLRLVLMVGRQEHAGQVRITPDKSGAFLRKMPRGGFLGVWLAVPEDLARWNAPKTAAAFEGQRTGEEPGALLISLPWDLSAEPPAAEEGEAEDERAAA